MTASSTQHPDLQDLVNLAREQLGRKKTERILAHCKECPECADKLLAAVREQPIEAGRIKLTIWNWLSIIAMVLAIIAVIVAMWWLLGDISGSGRRDLDPDVVSEFAEVVHAEDPEGWFEDAFTHAMVSDDGRTMLRVDSLGVSLLDLASGRALRDELFLDLDQVMGARFDGNGRIARFGNRRRDLGWFLEREDQLRLLSIPPDALPAWAPGNEGVIWARPPGTSVFLGDPPDHRAHDAGGHVLGVAWSPLSDAAYALTMAGDGSALLIRLGPISGEIDTVRGELDASALPNGLAVSQDGSTLFVALASAGAPRPETRHQPDADRDLDIYAVDARSGALRRIVAGPGDDFWPWVAGDHLYWTSNEWRASVVLVSMGEVERGETVVLAGALLGEADAQLPRWGPEGRLLAFTRGAWRLADWGLNLDTFALPVDADGAATGPAERLVVGYHEDRTPAWSPDGSWLAYRSRRSTTPVPYYAGPGVLDDIFARRVAAAPVSGSTEALAAAPVSAGGEVRLTDFGWEAGRPDWSRDGRRLVFDSWDRGGVPRVSRPWIGTFDAVAGTLVDVAPLTLPDDISGSVSAVWSPVSDELLLIERVSPRSQSLWIMPVDGSRAGKVVEFNSSTHSGADWTPDGRSLVYSALADGHMQLFSISREGGEPRRLTDESASMLHPSVSPDGRWVAATRLEQRKEVRRLPLGEIR